MTDMGHNSHVMASERRPQVAIWSYAEPWCGCSAQAGSRVTVNGSCWQVLGSYVGPVESPADLARELSSRWGENIDTGDLIKGGPWCVALLMVAGDGPGVEHECEGLMRHVGWR